MSLRVYDTISNAASNAYVYRVLENQKRGEVEISFEVTPAFELTGDVVIARWQLDGPMESAQLILGVGNTFKLKTWHYPTYTSQTTFLPFYPTNDANNPATTNIFSGLLGTYRVDMLVQNPHTQQAQVNVYVERIGGRSEDAFVTNLNWWGKNLTRFDIGAVSAINVPYDLTFDNIELRGDVPDPHWYSIKDYQGFKLDVLDKEKFWIGANDINDSSTYSNRTSLLNLSRYDYARVLPVNSGIWGMQDTFDELKYVTFGGYRVWGSQLTFDQLAQYTFNDYASYWGSEETFNELSEYTFEEPSSLMVPAKGLMWYIS